MYIDFNIGNAKIIIEVYTMSLIEERQKKAIINAYFYRLKASNVNVNSKILEQKFIKFSNDDLNNYLSNIVSSDANNMIVLLNKLNIPNQSNNDINSNIPNQSNNETTLNNTQSSFGGKQYVLKTKNNIMGSEDEAAA